jgi:hypothetical protein
MCFVFRCRVCSLARSLARAWALVPSLTCPYSTMVCRALVYI